MEQKKQIFFFHFAGGSCFSYDFLTPKLSNYEVHKLELPGRGKRAMEELLDNMDQAIDDYLAQIKKRRNGAKFLLFGHSMGAFIGSFVTKELEKINQFPETLIVSGSIGPGGLGEKKERHKMEGEEFINEIKDIGGVPEEFFEHEGLLEYFTPILKSDFKILELERYRPLSPLKTPIVAMMGTEEKDVEHITNWQNYTTSNFYYETLEGNHFYIHKHVDRLVSMIELCFEGKVPQGV